MGCGLTKSYQPKPHISAGYFGLPVTGKRLLPIDSRTDEMPGIIA